MPLAWQPGCLPGEPVRNRMTAPTDRSAGRATRFPSPRSRVRFLAGPPAFTGSCRRLPSSLARTGTESVTRRVHCFSFSRVPSDGQTSGFQPDDGCSIHLTRSDDVDAQQRSRIATPREPVRLRPTSPSSSGGPRRDPPKVVDRVRLAAKRLVGQSRAGCAADATNVRVVGFDSHTGLCGAAGDGSQVS